MSNGDDGNSNNDPALMTLGGQSLIQNTIIWDNYSGGETIYYDNELRVEYSIIEGLNCYGKDWTRNCKLVVSCGI